MGTPNKSSLKVCVVKRARWSGNGGNQSKSSALCQVPSWDRLACEAENSVKDPGAVLRQPWLHLHTGS